MIDGGVVDASAAWRDLLSPKLRALLDAGERDRFNAAIDLMPANAKRVITWRAEPFGCETVFDTYLEVLHYRITPDLAAQITTPVLVADPDNEGYFAGQPQRLYDMIPGERELVRFTEAEGAAGHCQPMARALAAQRFFDFLDEHVGLTD